MTGTKHCFPASYQCHISQRNFKTRHTARVRPLRAIRRLEERWVHEHGGTLERATENAAALRDTAIKPALKLNGDRLA